MHRRIMLLAASFFTVLATLVAIPPAAIAGGDRDCSDFPNQAAAQSFFISQGGPRSDPHRLDADGDGRACDSNPCPCSSATSPNNPPSSPPPNNPPPSTGGNNQPASEPIKRNRARVVKVIDGDTIDVRILPGGPRERVRLIGIDTPEVYGGQECGGPEASTSLKRILPRGTTVLLVSDRTQDLKDRYDRLLRYVMKGSLDVNRRQVYKGHAEVYVYDNNPFVRVRAYRTAQADAKAADRGIWGNC